MFTRASSTTITAYNPQEWGRNGHPGGRYVPQAGSLDTRRRQGTGNVSGMEAAMPSPPPPYTASPILASNNSQNFLASPHRSNFSASQTTSPTNVSEYNTPVSAAPSVSSVGYPPFQRSGPSNISITSGTQQASPTSFPPPPLSQRDRSTSRSGKTFKVSTLTSGNGVAESSPSVNSMEVLQHQTILALASAPLQSQSLNMIESSEIPPTARRAASAGAVVTAIGSYRGTLRELGSMNDFSWASGHFIPPPPPGPPPGARTQSLSRRYERLTSAPMTGSYTTAGPKRRTSGGTALEAMPPTPGDWSDGGNGQSAIATEAHTTGLHFDMRNNESSKDYDKNLGASASDINQRQPVQSNTSLSGTNSGPFLATREPITRGIRERRNESRAGIVRSKSNKPQNALEPSLNTWSIDMETAKPANLLLPFTSGQLSRRKHVNRALSSPLNLPITPILTGKGYSPRQDDTATPFSPPNDQNEVHLLSSRALPARPSKSLPVLPVRRMAGKLESGGLPSALSNGMETPISHIRHMPKKESNMPPPLTIEWPPTSSKSAPSPILTYEQIAFAQASLERHKLFAEREANASTDHEKLSIFAEFMVHESRLRRDEYGAAFDSMGSDVLDLTRDMWRSYSSSKRVTTPSSGSSSVRRMSSKWGARTNTQSPRGLSSASNSPLTPWTESDSPISSADVVATRPDAQRQISYQPILSPIPSMAMSTIPDDEDSRGRSSSRWWEASTRAGSVGGARRVERSKRESKYMGLPREAREYLQWEATEPLPRLNDNAPGPNQYYYSLGPDEYPGEKNGFGDPDNPSSSPNLKLYTPVGVQSPKVDVSRLITLPPPYPRHHPAINNSHPDLSYIRAILRQLSDHTNAKEIREQYESSRTSHSPRTGSLEVSAQRRRESRLQIQEMVTLGHISFAEAAKEEADFTAREIKRSCELAQKDFDAFSSQVKSPLNAYFAEKITRASTSIDTLRNGLTNNAQTNDPNQTQEEGDEQPELLERVTLMKWLFEAREQVHKELFELEAESDVCYKEVILTPYRLAGNDEKVREVSFFFAKDSQDRKISYDKKALQRFEVFLQIVNEHVIQGVEIQLSAFWDIAPSLLAVIHKVPPDLASFDILIPQDEYDENPSYNDFPMQYLYSLLLHSEKSAYQFIESQTNLLCLLHEIKTGVVAAGCRLLETQRALEGDDPSNVECEMQAIRRDEDSRLINDLKEKVELVDDQWRQALGTALRDCKGRINRFLVEQGGWDDGLEE